MVQERGSLRVLDTLRKRLQDAAGRGATYTGVLYGLHLEGRLTVMHCTLSRREELHIADDLLETDSRNCMNDIRNLLGTFS